MTRERAIEVLDRWSGFGHPDEEYSKVGFEANINDVEEAHDMAIAALREQEERSKGCEYCQMFDDPCGVPMIASEEDDCDRGIYLYNGYLCANGGSFCDAKVKFCPMCGRKLEVEG